MIHTYKPQARDVLIFNSGITHDGFPLEAGVKYILRSEVMYSPIHPHSRTKEVEEE